MDCVRKRIRRHLPCSNQSGFPFLSPTSRSGNPSHSARTLSPTTTSQYFNIIILADDSFLGRTSKATPQPNHPIILRPITPHLLIIVLVLTPIPSGPTTLHLLTQPSHPPILGSPQSTLLLSMLSPLDHKTSSLCWLQMRGSPLWWLLSLLLTSLLPLWRRLLQSPSLLQPTQPLPRLTTTPSLLSSQIKRRSLRRCSDTSSRANLSVFLMVLKRFY